MKKSKIILLFLSLLIFSSCNTLLIRTYGIKAPKQRTTEEIQKIAKKRNIPSDHLFILDSSYQSFINSFDTSQWLIRKNHLQPLQALYFDKNGEMVSWFTNCYAGGFPNFKWNRTGNLNSFVPATRAPIDSVTNLAMQLEYIKTLNETKPNADYFNTADYNVVIYWNVFMGRQSKRLIKCIVKNCSLAQDKVVNISFVNNDEIGIIMYDGF